MNNEAALKNIKKYENILEKEKKKFEYKNKKYTEVIKILEETKEIEEDDPVEIIVFKKYLECESIVKVAKYINDLGYRIKTDSITGERKYNSNDITKIIYFKKIGNEKLMKVVKDMQLRNNKNIKRKLM